MSAHGRPSRATQGDLEGDTVRRVLVEEHARLRALLGALDAQAAAVIRATAPAEPELGLGLEQTARALTEHMQREEPAIVALLPATPDRDRARVALREEHARQRDELATMCRCAATSDDAISLALTARAFVADVLLDMDLEDRLYLSVDGPRDVPINERT